MKNNDLSGDKNKSLQKKSLSWAEKSTHSPRNSAGSHLVTPRTMKKTARKSTGGPRTDWESTAEEGMIDHICEQSGAESLQTSDREMPSAEDRDSSGDKNVSLPRDNEVRASQADKSTCSSQNSARNQLVTSQAIKNTARKSTGGSGTEWKSIAEKNMIENRIREKSVPQNITGRHQKIIEVQLDKEVEKILGPNGDTEEVEKILGPNGDTEEVEKILGPNGDTEEYECSSEEDNSFYTNIHNIISDENLFGAEDGTDSGQAERSIASVSNIAACRSESESPLNDLTGKRTAATRPSRMDLHYKNPRSSKKRGHSDEDLEHGFEMTLNIPKKHREAKEASRIKATMSEQLKGCSVDIRRLSVGELVGKTMDRNDEQESDDDIMDSEEENKEPPRISRKTMQSRSSKKLVGKTTDRNDEQESDDNIMDPEEENKEPPRISRKTMQSRSSKRKAVASQSSENEKQEDSWSDGSVRSISVEAVRKKRGKAVASQFSEDESHKYITKKSAPPTQHRKGRPMRKSAITAKKLSLGKECVDKTSGRNDEEERDDGDMDSEEGNKENTHIYRKTIQSRVSKRKTFASQSLEDEGHISNRQKGSSDDSDSSSGVKPITKKSAAPVQHRKAKRVRHSALVAKKLLRKAEHSNESSGESDEEKSDHDISDLGRETAEGKTFASQSLEDEGHISNRQKGSSDDLDSSSGVKPIRKKSAAPVQHRKAKRVRHSALVAKKLLRKAEHSNESSGESDEEKSDHDISDLGRETAEGKTFASQSLEDEGHISNKQKGSSDDSDSSSGVKPIRKKSAAPVQHRKAKRVRHSALVPKKLLRKAEHRNVSSDESDEEKSDHDISHLGRETAEGCSSSEHNVSRQCFIKLRRLPIDPNPKSILLTASFLKDLSPVSGENSSVNKKREEDDSDWESSNGASSSSSSSSRSNRCSENNSDVSSVSSGSDFDYEVPTSEEEEEELRISAGTRSCTRMKLRKSVGMHSSMKPSVSDSHHAPRHLSSSSSDDDRSGHNASSSDDDRSGHNASSSNDDRSGHNASSSDDDRPDSASRRLTYSSDDNSDHCGEESTERDSASRRLTYSSDDNSDHCGEESTERDSASRRLTYSSDDNSDHCGEESTERAPAAPRRGRGRPQKIGTPDVAKPLEKAPAAPRRGRRGRPQKIGTPDVARPLEKDSSHSSSLNNSDVENMNSDTLTPSRKRNLQKRSLTSSAYDDDALRSIFNIYPCEVVCRKITFNPSNFNFCDT